MSEFMDLFESFELTQSEHSKLSEADMVLDDEEKENIAEWINLGGTKEEILYSIEGILGRKDVYGLPETLRKSYHVYEGELDSQGDYDGPKLSDE